LCDQFNGMLERIQQRDLAVQKAHEELEQRVAERTSFLNALVENSPLAIMVVDQQRIVRFCNGAFEEMFQYSKPEILGKPVDALLGIEEVLEEGSAALRSQRQVQAVLGAERMRRDGTMIDVEIHDTPLIVSGEVRGSLVLYQDISARKRVERAMQHAKEQAEAASRAKSEFLANMSHEIRTPINGIMGMTELVLDTQLDSEQREYLQMAKVSADALLTLINDILDFSKIEAGKLEIDSLRFSLNDTVNDTLKSLSVRAHQKGLELAYEMQPEVPDSLLGDPGRLRQIIVNLVGNAVKFTEHGEVSVRVAVESQGASEIELHFTIADTGIGIALEKQATIFEAFTQADGSMTRTYGGTGLGLTISSRLVQCMGGKIWVASKLGKGSQFHFTAKFGVLAGVPEKMWREIRCSCGT
jgi:two-component system, sensor histidine kinase and response regulator